MKMFLQILQSTGLPECVPSFSDIDLVSCKATNPNLLLLFGTRRSAKHLKPYGQIFRRQQEQRSLLLLLLLLLILLPLLLLLLLLSLSRALCLSAAYETWKLYEWAELGMRPLRVLRPPCLSPPQPCPLTCKPPWTMGGHRSPQPQTLNRTPKI